MILRARIVVTMDGAPIENGAVAVREDRIIDVGNFPEVSARHSARQVIDLGEQALLPGLINAHCHLDYTCLRGKIPAPKSFTGWIRAINREKSQLSQHDYLTSIKQGYTEAKKFGTTAIANLTACLELIREIRAPIRTWWFAELIDVRAPPYAEASAGRPERADKLVELAIESLEPAQTRGLAPHAPFTASQALYRRCEEAARQKNILLTTHLAESREEMQMFQDASGPLFDFMKSIGRDVTDCGNKTPLERFLGVIGLPAVASAQAADRALPTWIVAHLNELAESDFELLKKSRPDFHIVHTPRSHHYFGHSRFPFERLRALGFNICLGTDSLASNRSLSLFAEMRAFQRSYPGILPEKILGMATVNGAVALRQDNALGRIRPGFRADLIAVPCSDSANVFDEIVAFDGPINWVMVNGQA
jgi:cytosine/adenosine deaminase-related metal-dependent hydrolase